MFNWSFINFVYNEIEYFTYFNLWLMCLFFFMMFFVIFMGSNLFMFCSIFDVDGFIELLLSMIFVLILLIVIGSGFVMLSNHSFYGMFSFKNFSVFISGIQWVWEVDYLLGFLNTIIFCSNFYLFQSCEYELLMMAGFLVIFFVGSMDIVHSFGISCLGISMDCIPSRINLVYELVKLNGKMSGFCYELCGQYHSNMIILGFVL